MLPHRELGALKSPPVVTVLGRVGEALGRHPILVIALLLVPLLLQVSNDWYLTPDSRSYMSIARSFWQPGGPRNLGQIQLYYPPGYPLLLSPVFLSGVGEQPFAAIMILHVGLAGVLAVCVWQWGRLLEAPGLLLAALTLVNVSFWLHFRRPLSETTFSAVLFLSGLLLARGLKAKSHSPWALLLLGALLAGYLGTIRQAGMVIVGGIWFALLLQFRRRERTLSSVLMMGSVATVLAAGPGIAVMLREFQMSTQTGGVAYAGQLLGQSHFAANFIESIHLRVAEIGRLLVPGMFSAYARPGNWLSVQLVYIPIAVAVGMGWLRLMRRHSDVLLCSAPFYLLLYCVWPYDQGTRFLLPLLPLLWLCVWEMLGRWRLAPVLASGLLLAHAGVSVGHYYHDRKKARKLNAFWSEARACANQLREMDLPANYLAASRDGDALLPVEFLLDRSLGVSTPESPALPDRPVVVTFQQTAPPGYILRSRHGPYAIWTH